MYTKGEADGKIETNVPFGLGRASQISCAIIMYDTRWGKVFLTQITLPYISIFVHDWKVEQKHWTNRRAKVWEDSEKEDIGDGLKEGPRDIMYGRKILEL